MQQHQLEIIAANRPELTERILRVIRHRGFALNAMQLEELGKELKIELTVSSERPLHTLTRQLEKLLDIHTLRALERAPQVLKAC